MSDNHYDKDVQAINTAPMPWIGLNIATASAICFLAMAADTFYGFRTKKLWFPSRCFGLNAASLTLLAIATKLTLGLNTIPWGIQDKISKLSSIVLMTTVLGNFITSMGSMDNQAMLANVTALGIFIITVLVNFSLHIRTCHTRSELPPSTFLEYLLGVIVLFFLFILFVYSSLSIPTTKKYIEAKYHEKEQLALNEEAMERGNLSIKNLKSLVKRYWVMAATGNPQFVLARSAICTISESLSLLFALTLVESEIRINHLYNDQYTEFDSDYKWSTIWILVIPFLGVAVGIVPPTMRWFIVVSFKFSEIGSESYKIIERESSVREAAILLGETEKILELVQQRQLSGIVPDLVACIDDWRVSIKNRITRPSVLPSSPEGAVS